MVTNNNNQNVLVYDDENELTRYFHYQNGINNPIAGDTRTDFVYDGLSRMRKRIEWVWKCNPGSSPQGGAGGGAVPNGGGGGGNGCTWGEVSETWYVYDGMRVIQERDSNNVPTVSYTRGNDLSVDLEDAGGIGGLLARSSGYSSGNWTSHADYYADGNGNITSLIDGNQSVVAGYRYDPFGNIISKSGTLANANVYRFSSKEVHVNSGMYYYGFRFYDPNSQRWINRDPIGERGFNIAISDLLSSANNDERNLYEFASNDPINGWDLLGLADKAPADIPNDPPNPDQNASRQEREQFARDVMKQFQAWRNANNAAKKLDPCTLTSQWMFESSWGRSEAAQGKNLGGIAGQGPAGKAGKFKKYADFPQFYGDYTKLIENASRYKDALGKKGQDYVEALKKAGYDTTEPKYVEKVMQIYKQLGCK